MKHRAAFMLFIGLALFVIGALTRTYMNFVIRRSTVSSDFGNGSTELRYKGLIREHGAARWPLVVTVICIPLGILISFAAIIWNNRTT